MATVRAHAGRHRPPGEEVEAFAGEEKALTTTGDPDEGSVFEEALRLARMPLEISEALRHDPESPGPG